MKKVVSLLILILLVAFGCAKENKGEIIVDEIVEDEELKELTIFFVNDQHGQLDNFSKIKHIIDQEKLKTNVITACSGDIFSGNPVVDNYPEKGFPMIDIMNQVGFDISVLGNHEFDYGESSLKDRMNQANFQWVCANVDMGNSDIPKPNPFASITVDDVKVTFLGLLETNGSNNSIIPSTHPGRIRNLTFERPENVISDYADVKDQENADLFIALTHLGYNAGNALGDAQIATQFPFFDLIIGGHSHQRIESKVNDVPIFQSGSYLNYLGKIELTVKDRKIASLNYQSINLNTYAEEDAPLKEVIEEYNDVPSLDEIIGASALFHSRQEVGCFYTDALRAIMNVDVTIQNNGGIRSGLNQGDILRREIFEISPFNNATVKYEMSVAQIKEFIIGSRSGFHFSGIQVNQDDNDIIIKDLNGNIISDATILTLGTNDYIPAVFESYFPSNGATQSLTAAETLMSYLETVQSHVEYPGCNHYFRYQ